MCDLYSFTRNSLGRIKEKGISVRIIKGYKNRNKKKQEIDPFF